MWQAIGCFRKTEGKEGGNEHAMPARALRGKVLGGEKTFAGVISLGEDGKVSPSLSL